MLNNIPMSVRSGRAFGFTLIELMISIVVGMLVIAGATTLIVAINQSNANTINSARLTQELRTTLEVIASDLRRARAAQDPIGTIGQVAVAQALGNTCAIAADSIAVPSTGCIAYGYDNKSATSNVCDGNSTGNFHAAYLSGVGTVVLATKTGTTGYATCPTTGTTLTSNQVEITALTFAPTAPSTQIADGAITITITGRPRYRSGVNYGSNGVTRTLTQMVDVRSGKSGT